MGAGELEMTRDMKSVVVIAPGESLTEADCDLARAAAPVIAVTEAYKLAPWCDVLVANDRAWWAERPDARALSCPKYSTRRIEGVEQIDGSEIVTGGSSSGVLALWVSARLGAKRILLLGFDNKGTHFCGPYKGRLTNTHPTRFAVFEQQFRELGKAFQKTGVEVRNCTPETALKAFPLMNLEEGLVWLCD
jgi:hypothetical protein